jgi:GTPase SAR1 family protein
MLVVGFIGLPSAGKSTMINALAGKRVLESGVCRTTTDVCDVGARNEAGAAKWLQTELRSDDGVEFCAVDLPGICDAEDTESAFDALTLEWAAKCDVIVWVTDARTAFSTKHESAAVARIRESIQAKADDDGSLYQFLVVLAKYEGQTEQTLPCHEYLPGEIRSPTESSNIDARLESAVSAFPRVAKFNAFARIATRPSSVALRSLVCSVTGIAGSGLTGPTGLTGYYDRACQVDFELKWAMENIMEKRLAQMSRVLRDTRRRVIANAPRYDRRVQLHFAKNDTGTVGCIVPGTALPSVSIALDRATARWSDALISGSLQHEQRYRGSNMGTWSKGVRYTPTAVIIGERDQGHAVTQLMAPTVRPVFGDVYIVPAVIEKCGGTGNCVYSEYIGIYTGREDSDTYVLKVGEASHAELHSLALALSKEPRNPSTGNYAKLVDVTNQ